MFKIGQKVKAVSATHGWGVVRQGDVGVVRSINTWGMVVVDFPNVSGWGAASSDLVPFRKVRRTAAVLEPKNEREKVAINLIRKVTHGKGKFTAVKVESEGRLDRCDQCTPECTRRQFVSTPHDGCKYFGDVKVANDFILKHLAQYGLARKCKEGDNPWGHLYEPKLPLVYSKVYTDSETEWTTTLSLKKASDVLYAPMLVDAFNALAEANGNGIDVSSSGMHTAFLQGKDGIYPISDVKDQDKLFNNFAKSMRPLLPALYLLGANRIEEGIGVTRATGCRQPLISNSEKYSAIAYRYGAVEFRVFDTCYENRDQILDNIVVMSQCINKYWHAKYRKPNVSMDKLVFFGTADCSRNYVNKLESLYVLKDHIVLLNAGLRCIKPPYLSVKELKRARNFNLTVRGIKDIVDIEGAKSEYDSHVRNVEFDRAMSSTRYLRDLAQDLTYSVSARNTVDIKKTMRSIRAKASSLAKKKHPLSPIEQIAYQSKFGAGFPLGGV